MFIFTDIASPDDAFVNFMSRLITVYCRVSREHYFSTEEFIDAVAENLKSKLPSSAGAAVS